MFAKAVRFFKVKIMQNLFVSASQGNKMRGGIHRNIKKNHCKLSLINRYYAKRNAVSIAIIANISLSTPSWVAGTQPLGRFMFDLIILKQWFSILV
jgi:hypothetical protein